MEYRILLQKGNIILAESKTDYIVGVGYDETLPVGCQWNHGLYFAHNIDGLTSAIEAIKRRTEENYITRARIEELATYFKDCALGDDDIAEVISDMEENEIEFFGLDKEDFVK